MQYLKRFTIMIMLGGLLALSLLASIQQTGAASPTATTRYVAPSGNCGAATPCYATVQAAVDAADPGDEIKVAEGTYNDIHTIPDLNTAIFTATQIVAVTSGYATFKQNHLGGNAVSLAGDNGNRYYYAHLSGYEGASRRVVQGEVIGYNGDTGNATGIPHLHFEVRLGGSPVNPAVYL